MVCTFQVWWPFKNYLAISSTVFRTYSLSFVISVTTVFSALKQWYRMWSFGRSNCYTYWITRLLVCECTREHPHILFHIYLCRKNPIILVFLQRHKYAVFIKWMESHQEALDCDCIRILKWFDAVEDAVLSCKDNECRIRSVWRSDVRNKSTVMSRSAVAQHWLGQRVHSALLIKAQKRCGILHDRKSCGVLLTVKISA